MSPLDSWLQVNERTIVFTISNRELTHLPIVVRKTNEQAQKTNKENYRKHRTWT